MVQMVAQNNLKSIPLSKFTEFLQQSDLLQEEKAYNRVGWFRRAQDIRTEAVRTYPYDLMRGDTVIATEAPEDDDIVPDEINIFPIIDDLSADLDMFGAAYAIYETNRFGRNGAWRRLHPKTITPKYNETTGDLAYFERHFRYNSEKVQFKPNEVLWLWMPNIGAEIGNGKGISQSALLPATALHNIDKFQSAFFENGALNPTIVNIKGLSTQPKEEKERLTMMFQRLLSGIKNAFGVHPVDGDISLYNLMQPLREMAMDELSNQKREDVLSAMGVPHSMVISNAANHATALADRLNFYDNAINGHVALIQMQLNERLFKPAGYRLFYRKNRLEVYQVSESEKANRLSSQLDRAVIDVAEYRELMDMEPNPRLESIFYARLEAQAQLDDNEVDMQEAVDRLQLNPTGESNGRNDSKAMVMEDQNITVTDHIDLWRKKAMKRFQEGTPEKAIEFHSDVINPLQHKAISEALQVAGSADDVAHIMKEATVTAPLWDAY